MQWNSFYITPQNGVNGIVPVGTIYSWSAPSGLNIGGTAGSGTSIGGTLANPTNTPQASIYNVTPSVGSFQGTPFTVTVTVNPVSAITPMTASVCSGLPFTVTPADATNGVVLLGTTYSWSAPQVTPTSITGGMPGSGTPSSITGTLNNPTNASGTATYSILPSSAGCFGSTFTLTVTVNPVPAITPITVSECSKVLFTVTPVNNP